MTFLRPQFLWLLPLAGLPILIHLLNRLRYRRVQWAAMAFLRRTERRAVRRARLRQVLLLILRTLLLLAALLALTGPVFRGGLAGYLGRRPTLVVLLDASASMARSGPSGSAFERVQRFGAEILRQLPRGARAISGPYARTWRTPFDAPVSDVEAVSQLLAQADGTAGSGNVPLALAAAAEALSAPGGTILLLTDLQASDWHTADAGAWETARRALGRAGRPRVMVAADVSGPNCNLSVVSVRAEPAIIRAGDAPRLIATVAAHGGGTELRSVLSLDLDGARLDARGLAIAPGSRSDVVFRLPPLSPGAHAGRVALEHDSMPLDDARFFVLRAVERIPALIIAGDTTPATYVAKALSPTPEVSLFRPRRIEPDKLAEIALGEYPVAFLLGSPPSDARGLGAIKRYVREGGLLIAFPDSHSPPDVWDFLAAGGVTVEGPRHAERQRPIRVAWTSPLRPVTATLVDEGVGRVEIMRLLRMKAARPAEVLATTSSGDSFLLRVPIGDGLAYVFAVSAHTEDSNLPVTPVFPLTVHRAAREGLAALREPISMDVFSPIRLTGVGAARIRLPDGRLVPLGQAADRTGRREFSDTSMAGIYRLVRGDGVEGADAEGVPVAALNVPASESATERIAPETVRELLGDVEVRFADLSAPGVLSPGGEAAADAAFAVAAAVFMIAQSVLAWSMSRPGRS